MAKRKIETNVEASMTFEYSKEYNITKEIEIQKDETDLSDEELLEIYDDEFHEEAKKRFYEDFEWLVLDDLQIISEDYEILD